MRIDLLNGPNLNLLGTREPARYGTTTLAELEAGLRTQAAGYGLTLHCMQSNHEGALIDALHAAAAGQSAGVIINPGAYTHTSIALRDAFLATGLPFVEVHISNVYARESYRHVSFLRDLASGIIVGMGVAGYGLALQGLATHLRQQAPQN